MPLTIQERLKDLRIERGLNLEQLAEKTGLSKSALGNYESDDTKDISLYALTKLADFYGVTTDYLLTRSEMKKHSNTGIDELHLSDEMIDLLKSGKLNTSILCELVAHKDFGKLLADIEIYVNGIASMQIQNLNVWVDTARDEILKKYNPDENDSNMYLLQAAHVNEDEYFAHRIFEDIRSIIADMKEAHKGRVESAPENTVTDELKRDLEEAANLKGSRLDKLIFIFCKQMKIKYNMLNDENKKHLINIIKKSEWVKSYVPQRGKKR